MSDPCCILCRHPTGICLSKFSCEHHVTAQKQDDANHRASRTIRDPVGDQAVNNVMRARRKEQR